MDERKTIIRILNFHRGTMIGLVLASLLLWGFIDLADDVMEGEVQEFDEMVVLSLRVESDLSDPVGPLWFEEMMRDTTGLGGVGVLSFISLMSFGYLVFEHKYKLAGLIVCAIASGILLSFLLKSGFTRPRPDLVPHGSHVYTSSFPSGHSMMSALVYLTLASILVQVQERKRVKIYLVSIALILTVSIGFSRVYLGVHWPTDVVAGWIAGAFWAILFYIIGRVLQISGAVEEPGVEPELEEPPRASPDPDTEQSAPPPQA